MEKKYIITKTQYDMLVERKKQKALILNEIKNIKNNVNPHIANEFINEKLLQYKSKNIINDDFINKVKSNI